MAGSDIRRAADGVVRTESGRPYRETIILRRDQAPAVRHVIVGLAIIVATLVLVGRGCGLSLGVWKFP